MTSADPTDEVLRHLKDPDRSAPPMAEELRSAAAGARPARTRRPRRSLAVGAAVSLAYAGGLLALVSVRRDLHGLPLVWLVTYSAGWAASFLALAHLATVPRRGEVMPRWRLAGIAGAAAAIGFTAAGLLVPRSVPGVSSSYAPTVENLVVHAHPCVELGLLVALVPAGLFTLAARGAVPVGSRWVGLGLGAAGGCLGGLLLHLYCPIADRLHLGLVHGGVVIAAGILGAVVIPRLVR